MSGQQAGAGQRREERSAPTSSPSRFVLGLDVGSTVIRCHVYDRTARVRGSSAQKVTRRGWAGALTVPSLFLHLWWGLGWRGRVPVARFLSRGTQRSSFTWVEPR